MSDLRSFSFTKPGVPRRQGAFAGPIQQPRRRGFWAGAQGGRFTADWIFSPMVSASAEWKTEGWKLRGRAREMVRNDPTFARYVQLMADNVVGECGVEVCPKLYNRKGELLDDESRALEEAFEEFSRRENFSRDGRLSREEFEAQIVRLTPVDGESFVRALPTKRNRFGLHFELIDPDLIDNEFFQEATASQNLIFAGIEYDADARPLAYHMWPDYSKRKARVAVPAQWMQHLYWPRRPGDPRGITRFAPAMMLARMLHGYREAEIVAARTAAAKMAFLLRTEPEAVVGDDDLKPDLPMEAAAGTIDELPFGYDVKFWDPTHPNEAYDAYVRSVKGDIAASLSHAYVTLFGDWSATNYSSGRMPVMQERDHYRMWQQWLVNGHVRPGYEIWVELAFMRGAITLPTANYREHLDAAFRPRTWPMFNPTEETAVMKDLLAMRLASRGQLASQVGPGLEEVLEQWQADEKLFAKYGQAPPAELGSTPKGTNQGADNGAQGTAEGAAENGNDRASGFRLVRGQ